MLYKILGNSRIDVAGKVKDGVPAIKENNFFFVSKSIYYLKKSCYSIF